MYTEKDVRITYFSVLLLKTFDLSSRVLPRRVINETLYSLPLRIPFLKVLLIAITLFYFLNYCYFCFSQ